MSRGENSTVAAIAVITIAGLFLLLLFGGIAFAVFGVFAVRSAAPPPTASMAPSPTAVSPGPSPPLTAQIDSGVSNSPVVIEGDGTIKFDGQVYDEALLRQYFSGKKDAGQTPVVYAVQPCPPERVEWLQQLCLEVTGNPADVKIVNTATEAPVESVAP